MATVSLTRHIPVLNREGKYLLEGEGEVLEGMVEGGDDHGRPVTHWKEKVKVRLVVDGRSYSRRELVPDVPWEFVTNDRYKPLFYVDELHLFRHHLQILSSTKEEDPYFHFTFQPTSLGTFRLLSQLKVSMELCDKLGIEENDKEQLTKGQPQILMLLSPDHLYQLILTYLVSILHTILSLLAFKNDIGFWRGRENLAGLSQTSIVGNAVCSVIIFLFLYDSPRTSWLVLGTIGISTIIDIWKVTKVLKLDFHLHRGNKSEEEKQTDKFDATGMYYLSMILYPLVIAWAIYSLYTHTHRSWWSWFISSAANGVYAFGFLMMTPQIFINYKLKSVAHMPWRAMTYKVFNTFIDDLFAWIIEMPTVHRLATLRDDIIFFIYLYQYWIYPVDKSRPNEFGYVYEKVIDNSKETEQKNPTVIEKDIDETKKKLD